MGIPARTMMANDDDDRCYHKPWDEIKRIDIANLAERWLLPADR